MSIDAKDKLKKYIPLVDFIAEVLGKNSEVVLHDLTDLDKSIIAIRNNHISNREVGAPATDLVLKIVKENKNENRNFISNYTCKNKFNKQLTSSTFFIRDDDTNAIIGVLCVNTDESVFNNLLSSISELCDTYKKQTINHEEEISESENLSLTIEELAENAIKEITASRGVTIEYLKQEDKLEIIEALYLKGIFLLKGAVVEVAKALKSSEASVYRYVQIIKRREESNK